MLKQDYYQLLTDWESELMSNFLDNILEIRSCFAFAKAKVRELSQFHFQKVQ